MYDLLFYNPERTNSRNGYRQREWDARADTVELAIGETTHWQLLPGLVVAAPPPPTAAAKSSVSRSPATRTGPAGWRFYAA
jgi:hypothetical protein